MNREEREELINNIIESPANQFGENEDDRACLEATPEDTLAKLMPAANVDLDLVMQASPSGKVTDEEPLVIAVMNFGAEEKEQVSGDQPLVAPVMSFEK